MERDRVRSSQPTLLFRNIRQLLTLRSSSGKAGARIGRELGELGLVEDGAVLVHEGKIAAVGHTREILRHSLLRKQRAGIEEVDCRGKVVLPGFVDSHTHPVFAAPRLMDFEKRVAGASYQEIAQAGGGIRSSIRAVRETSQSVLVHRILAALEGMASHGTTTVEAKSGYGLSFEAEIKSLAAIRAASKQFDGTVVPTLLGAHVVPPEYRGRSDEYVRLVCEEMIPAVARKKLAEFVDVFVEKGAFTAAQGERVLRAARECRLGTRVHIGQLSRTDLKPFARFGLTSLDHADYVNAADIRGLAKGSAVVTLLPAANYFLGLDRYPPARRMIDAGVAIALATDYNPGTAPTVSMPFVLSVACTQMKLSPAEAIVAATYNGACALRLQETKGSLECGKDADLAVFDAADYREIPYWIAMNCCRSVLMNGRLRHLHSC